MDGKFHQFFKSNLLETLDWSARFYIIIYRKFDPYMDQWHQCCMFFFLLCGLVCLLLVSVLLLFMNCCLPLYFLPQMPFGRVHYCTTRLLSDYKFASELSVMLDTWTIEVSE